VWGQWVVVLADGDGDVGRGQDGAHRTTREPGFSWGPELFVGLGLAAAVSAALLVARRRYRRGYWPGSGDRRTRAMLPVGGQQVILAEVTAANYTRTGLPLVRWHRDFHQVRQSGENPPAPDRGPAD
jgi:hypothetical protein